MYWLNHEISEVACAKCMILWLFVENFYLIDVEFEGFINGTSTRTQIAVCNIHNKPIFNIIFCCKLHYCCYLHPHVSSAKRAAAEPPWVGWPSPYEDFLVAVFNFSWFQETGQNPKTN